MTVSNPGATAEEIETEITKRIEDAVNTISEIEDAPLHLGRGALDDHHHLFPR